MSEAFIFAFSTLLLGVGKESDVYIAINDEEERFAVKLHRLGRTSFRKVYEKRDYHKNNNKVHNWIYMSRLAATREFSFLKALHEAGLPVPKPIDSNRHCIVMELVDGSLLNHFNGMDDPASLYNDLMDMLLSLANDYGVVHGDFNEFNIMLQRETLKPVLIDFPQMISVDHRQAKEYFDRDVECIVNFFKRFNFHPKNIPQFDNDVVIDENNKDANSSRIKVPLAETEDYLAVKQTSDEDAQSGGEHLSLTSDIEKINLSDPDFHQSRKDSFRSNDSDDSCSHSHRRNLSPSQVSQRSYSVAGSTFTTDEIRSKLKKEFASRIRRDELRRAAKGVKGEDSAVRRQRRLNERRIKEDSNLDASIFD